MMLAQRLRPSSGRKVRTVRVRVKGGYQPSVVHARVGEPLRIVFSREETASCSEHVVFPAFGKSAMLPPFEDVTLELVPERAGEYEFTCQMGMLRGRLVVDEGTEARPRSAEQAPVTGTEPNWTSSLAEEQRDTLVLAFAGWLCSVPLLLLVAVPFFGWKAGAALVLAWFAIAALACFFLCARRVAFTRSSHTFHGIFRPFGDHRGDGERRREPAVVGNRDEARDS